MIDAGELASDALESCAWCGDHGGRDGRALRVNARPRQRRRADGPSVRARTRRRLVQRAFRRALAFAVDATHVSERRSDGDHDRDEP